MPKNKVLTPELIEERKIKDRRTAWIEMIEQLRFGSPVAKSVKPGNCQDMLDFLVTRYCKDSTPVSHMTHQAKLREAPVWALFQELPNEEWARKERPPKSEENHPIFIKDSSGHIYLDGRRRLNKWYREDPNQIVKYWCIEPI